MNWLQLSPPSPALISTVSTPRERARDAIRAGLPPWALETYQIHIPSPRKAEPSAAVGAGAGCWGAAEARPGAAASTQATPAASAIERRRAAAQVWASSVI